MLPTEVVSKILQFVPVKPRFSSGSLVCHAWHSSAVTATSFLTTQLTQQHQLDSIGLWLQRQGTNLQALSVTGNNVDECYMLVPFQQLQRLTALELKDLEVTEAFTSSRRTCSLTELTSLQLNQVRWRGISALTQLTKLRQLQLSNVTSDDKYKSDVLVNHSLQRALGVCTHLTSLVIDWDNLRSGSTVNGLGNLTDLQQLQVTCATSVFDDMDLVTGTLNSLPWSLTHLTLEWSEARDLELQLAPSTTPRIIELARLRHLAIRGNGVTHFDPQLLHNLLQLQHLELKQCQVTNDADIDVLLAVIAQLKQLQHLCLYGSMRCITSAEQYTALVSSTQLTFLDLTDCSMPDSAVYYISAAQQQYPALQTLIAGDEIYGDNRGEHALIWRTCSGALDRLVRSCPGLQELHFLDGMQVDYEALTALKDLTALSKLRLVNSGVSNDSLTKLGELGLPALRDLEVITINATNDTRLTGEGMWCLRRMTQLTRLVLGEWGDDDKYLYGCDWRVEFANEAGLTDLRERMIDNYQQSGDYQLDITSNALLLLEQQQQECADAVRALRQLSSRCRNYSRGLHAKKLSC